MLNKTERATKAAIARWSGPRILVSIEKLKTFSAIKERLFRLHTTCQKCGWGEKNQFRGKAPLQVNHKDGNRKNHSLSNLEVLCPNCHSLTEHFMFYGKKHTTESKEKIRQAALRQHSS